MVGVGSLAEFRGNPGIFLFGKLKILQNLETANRKQIAMSLIANDFVLCVLTSPCWQSSYPTSLIFQVFLFQNM